MFNFFPGVSPEEFLSLEITGIYVSEIQGENSTTVVGPVNTIRRLKDDILARGISFEEIDYCGVGIHSKFILQAKEELLEKLKQVNLELKRILLTAPTQNPDLETIQHLQDKLL